MSYLLFFRSALSIPAPQRRFITSAVLLFAVANIFSGIPSFSRFLSISIALLMASFIATAAIYTSRERKLLLLLFVPALAFALLLPLRFALGQLDVFSFMPTPFLIFPRRALL